MLIEHHQYLLNKFINNPKRNSFIYLIVQQQYLFLTLMRRHQQQTNLIVIHEYSPTDLQSFLNPKNKPSQSSMPKIYGRKGKSRFLYNIQQRIKNQNSSFQRQCCHLIYSAKYKSTQIETQRKSKINLESFSKSKNNCCNKFNCLCSRPLSKRSISDNKGNSTQIKKFMKNRLPQLKQFSQMVQKDSHKKILKTDKNISQSKAKESKLRRFTEDKSQQKVKKEVKDQQIQTQPRHLSSRGHEENDNIFQAKLTGSSSGSFKDKQIKNMRYKTQPNSAQKPQVQVRQNIKINQSKMKNIQSKITQEKQRNNSEDSIQISSFTMKNQASSTVFHQIKKMSQTKRQKRPNSKAYSILSNGLFKIPQEDQYEDYLQYYKPINPAFNVRELIKKENFHIVPTENHVYFGQIVDRKKNGEGITVSQKEIYQGKYQNNLKVQGSEKNRDGKYTGQFLRGKRHGKGKFQWHNGEVFEGEWRDGKKNGFGVWKSPKGDFYEGQWRDNRQHGKGYYVHKGGSKYRGYFKQFLKHGKGDQQFANGDKYSGNYEFGKPHGYGKYTWKNGDEYQGQFIDGSREGRGKLKRTNGQIYQGQFKHDSKHGLGREKYKSGEVFQGEFKNGERYKGKLRTKNGAQISIAQT